MYVTLHAEQMNGTRTALFCFGGKHTSTKIRGEGIHLVVCCLFCKRKPRQVECFILLLVDHSLRERLIMWNNEIDLNLITLLMAYKE